MVLIEAAMCLIFWKGGSRSYLATTFGREKGSTNKIWSNVLLKNGALTIVIKETIVSLKFERNSFANDKTDYGMQ